MIDIWSYDVEILPNFFSVTFINLGDYLKRFKDCVDKNNNPIPLVEKYSVPELLKNLSEVESKQFFITDKDDSQLFALAGFINQMNQRKVTNLYGFNNLSYDKLMIACFLMYFNLVKNTKELIEKLYETSKKIIELQDNKDAARKDFFLNSLKEYKLPFVDVDVFRIFALNKVGQGINELGERVFFGKSLKQTSINIKFFPSFKVCSILLESLLNILLLSI